MSVRAARRRPHGFGAFESSAAACRSSGAVVATRESPSARRGSALEMSSMDLDELETLA